MVSATRKVTASRNDAAKAAGNGRSTASLVGTLIEADLSSSTKRGRKATPVPAELAANLATTRETPGVVVEFTGNQSEVMRWMGQVRKWCVSETEVNDTPTKASFGTVTGNFKTKDVPASESITVRARAVRQNAEVVL